MLAQARKNSLKPMSHPQIASLVRRLLKNREKEGVIFDGDGVLFNSRAANSLTVKQVLEEYRFDVPQVEIFKHCCDGSPEIVLKTLVPDLEGQPEKIEEMVGCMRGVAGGNLGLIGKTPLVGLVKELWGSKTRMAVATNRDGSTITLLRKFEILHCFRGVVTCLDAPQKPAPEMVNEALKRMGVQHCSAVMLGDTEVDEKAARGAGVMPLLVKL